MFILTILLVLVLRPVALCYGLTDKPCSRKNHTGEIPLIGGICIYLSLLSSLYWIPVQNYGFVIPLTLIVACGIIDDFKHLNFRVRLCIEILAALIMITVGGIEITSLGNLFGLGEIQLGIFSPIVTIFAVVGGINAFNMTDGIDGATAGISLVAISLLCGLITNHLLVEYICLFFIPALIAFLLFNARIFGRKNATIFLGDAGSMLLGFTVCYLVIIMSQGENRVIAPVTVLWVLALPLIDAVCIMVRRTQKGRSVFTPDREHLHHILPVAGYTVNQTLVCILLISFILGSFGILGEKLFKLPEWLMFSLFMVLFMLYYWAMNHAWKVMKVVRKLHND